MKHFFAIIGGMGTEATEMYIHLVNQLTPTHQDQDYLNYILVNHATIPDRTAYIENHHNANPLIPLTNDIKQINQLHPDFYTIPCNTAHYFYTYLQRIANAPILHMPKEVIKEINKHDNIKRVGLIATQGTIDDCIYDKVIQDTPYQLVKPTKTIEQQVMHLIYYDVKERGLVNKSLYHQVINEMVNQLHCDTVILGCTELSYIQEALHEKLPVMDSQGILAQNTVKLAEKEQKKL